MKIYLIAMLLRKNFTLFKYRLIDIDSREIREVESEDLIEAIKNNKWAFKNVSLSSEPYIIEVKEKWSEIPKISEEGKLLTDTKYIINSIDLLENTANLVDINGDTSSIDLDIVYNSSKYIAGVKTGYNGDYRKLVETEPTKDEIELLSITDKQYKSFILMTKALGMDCAFNYKISGKAVVFQKYTGKSKHAIVPKFINVIDTRAFQSKNITDISLNDGLKVIGTSAFGINDIGEVDIPKTVTRICSLAFYGNKKLFKWRVQNGRNIEELNENNFRIHNKETVVSKQTLKGEI